MTDIRFVLSQNMKSHRKKLHISQAALAEKIGTATNYISKIEAERQFPSVQMIEKIADALHIDTVDLFSVTEIKKADLEKMKADIMRDIESAVSENLKRLTDTSKK